METNGTRAVVFIHSEAYFRVLERLPVHPKREEKVLALLRALSRARDKQEEDGDEEENESVACFGMQFVAPSKATYDELTRFHSKAYVDALQSSSGDQEANAAAQEQLLKVREEFNLVDDAYVFPGLYEYCQYVAGASITAADALRHLIHTHRQEEKEDTPAPVVVNLGGGRHHAMRSQASGFCYVNDVVLGIQRLLRPGDGRLDRVLCIDIDVHHGDGVQEAFYFSRNVTTMSFHLFEPTFFPGTGNQDETGIGRGKNHNINVPLRRGITDDQFTALFNRIVEQAVVSVSPQAIVLVCGVDTLAKDDLGGFNMTSQGVTNCVKKLLSTKLPLLLLGGGGYSGADACKCLAAVVTTIVSPSLYVLEQDIPEHDYYEEYGPEFRMATKTVIHRPNQNTVDSLAAVGDQAILILQSAQASEANRQQEPSKRKR
ncbi:hypothetical protein Poli38472_005321 [Pythium oligandrum]|uniref:Histone deacetylase n=1 Tax=Pythium oligandrum TaxID=41045 RepID=A0A8K1CGR5_PYTOL|nr:hypothetical protein Poli38472_005321 [Pythium oligandrum]|eukprot:TMW62703.1 hypothetical protein Poli38472_005321 [Pythium oligandrum]